MASNSQDNGKLRRDLLRNCCRCTRTGRCKNSVCCKQARQCVDCLPGCLGTCENQNHDGNVVAETSVSKQSGPVDDNSDIVPLDTLPSSDVRSLPEFLPIGAPAFVWGDVDGDSFVHSLL